MSWFITNFIASFLLPPLSFLLLLALGFLLLYRQHKLGKPLILAAFGLLWVASTPYFAKGALHLLEAPTAFTTRYQTDLLAFLPRAEALRDSKVFTHEVIGLLWYRVKSAISNN